MVTAANRSCSRRSPPAWHDKFLAMLPAIIQHACFAFRYLSPEAKQEAVQAVVCCACAAVARLAELNKLDLCYPSVLAGYGVAHVKAGRNVGCQLNCHDVASKHCQKVNGFVMERLDRYNTAEARWQDIVVEDRRYGPFDTVRTKLDFTDWLTSLERRDRRMAESLAIGNRTCDVARRFRVSDGRISQLRRKLVESWEKFIDDEPGDAAAVPA